MNIEERRIEFCDISVFHIQDVFPNPTEEQKKIWERITDEYEELDGWIENHRTECIKEIKKMICEVSFQSWLGDGKITG